MYRGHRRYWIPIAVVFALAASPAAAQQRPPANRTGGLNFPGLPVRRPPQRQATLPQRQAPQERNPQQAGPPPRIHPRVAAGFQLAPADQAVLDAMLKKWDENNARIKTFSCKFTLTEYRTQLQLGQQQQTEPPTHDGYLSYAAPDKGSYQVAADKEKQGAEHWVCDGQAVYEIRADKKEIIEMPLPQELRGKAIADAPLPFVFGSSANKMQQRFWMRVSTLQRNFTNIKLEPGTVLLEAMPKTAQDAANFRLVQIMFNEKDMTPFAINEFLPNHSEKNEQRLVYVFEKPSINNAFEAIKNLFSDPKKKWGYKVIRQKPPAAQELPQQPLVPSADSRNRPAQRAPLR